MLLVLATLGSCVIAASTHFASFFLALELLSVSLYVMIGYVFRRTTSMEAAVKYLILAAASSAFLLFGMALLYAEWGTMEFESLAAGIGTGVAGNQVASAAGIVLMLTGIGFKLAVVPLPLVDARYLSGCARPGQRLRGHGVERGDGRAVVPLPGRLCGFSGNRHFHHFRRGGSGFDDRRQPARAAPRQPQADPRLQLDRPPRLRARRLSRRRHSRASRRRPFTSPPTFPRLSGRSG